MQSGYQHWREYQEAVATLFRGLGCTASIEARTTGARATHSVDVLVTFRQHGVECQWIIECKLWKKRVEKKDILTLKSIVEDVGADRGIIFCENGYQAGARDAARNTNILLVSSLEEFKATVRLEGVRTPLIHEGPAQPTAPPIYAFPDGDQPHHLLSYGGRVFVGNWQTGNIAVIDPSSKSIENTIQLDKYERSSVSGKHRIISRHQPGRMACADGRLFVGQIFSDFVLAIDIETQSIVKRIKVPGGGEGSIAASRDGRSVFFASNRANRLFIIDSATYEYEEVAYPAGGRGSMCVLPHPTKPILYIGVQRGGTTRSGRSYFGGNSFLATYDLIERCYIGNLYLAEVENNRSDDSAPVCLTFDEQEGCLFVGMFQSQRGICRVDERGSEIEANFRFAPNANNKHFRWVDPLSQALHRDKLLSVNRNNCELVTLDKRTGRVEHEAFLGVAPNGPNDIVVVENVAIISYPARHGLIFIDL